MAPSNKRLINPEQAAFRQDRSIEDQITYLTQEIEDAFQGKKHTLAVWIDMVKAFDKVSKDSLKLKLRHCGVAGRMYKWIDQHLKNRRARVQIQHHQNRVHDRSKTYRNGCLITNFLSSIHESYPITSAKECERSHICRWPCYLVQRGISIFCQLQTAACTPRDSSNAYEDNFFF